MRGRMAVGAFTAAVLVVTSACGADMLKSGPEVGKDIPGPFHPLNVTGHKAGQKNCLV
jgi:hypothetical protein